jgi:hypothetical protein
MAEDLSFIGSQPKVEDAGGWGTRICPRAGFAAPGQKRKSINCDAPVFSHESNYWPGYCPGIASRYKPRGVNYDGVNLRQALTMHRALFRIPKWSRWRRIVDFQ